jgi:hypothetical protein
MNYKLNSYLSILAITCAVAVPLLSATARALPVQAALTPPSDYDYFFRSYDNPSPSPDFWRLGDWNGTTSPNGTNDVRFTRTADSTYYNYSTTRNNTTDSWLPTGLEITMTFNRSNTSWTQVSGTSFYNPTDYTKIGSDNTVGTPLRKFEITITNNTIKNYNFIIDTSASSATNWHLYYNDIYYNRPYIDSSALTINNIFIPTYSSILLFVQSVSTAQYLQAWYLQDLGVSDSYDSGYDDGYDAGYDVGESDGYEDGLANNPNVLINAAESLIGMFVNFTFILFSLEVFGVSILTIVGVLFGIIAITWILKTIRG